MLQLWELEGDLDGCLMRLKRILVTRNAFLKMRGS